MNPVDKLSLTNPVHFLALGFGLGKAPKAPGTFGTLAAFPLFYFMQDLAWPAYWGLIVLFSILGVYLCGKTAEDMGAHDHPAIVWDEVVGMLITLWAVPQGYIWWVLAFILFRLFDILKPWPISYFDRKVHGGLGIMLDDLLAGVLGLATLQLFVHYL